MCRKAVNQSINQSIVVAHDVLAGYDLIAQWYGARLQTTGAD